MPPRSPGHDAPTRFTVSHEGVEQQDRNAIVDGWIQQLVEHRAPYGSHTAHGHGDPYAHGHGQGGHGDHHQDGHRSGPGVGTTGAAGAAGLAVGVVVGGMVAAEVVDEVGDFLEGDKEEEEG